MHKPNGGSLSNSVHLSKIKDKMFVMSILMAKPMQVPQKLRMLIKCRATSWPADDTSVHVQIISERKKIFQFENMGELKNN